MASESDQDLPRELLDKLRNLELELEDGDITQKGFEKKKASLLQQYQQDDPDASKQGTNAKEEESESGQQHDFGPEPSAADVVDFLDYLPSPTHSPPKPQAGAALMEQNHNNNRPLSNQGQTQVHSPQGQIHAQQHNSHYPATQSSPAPQMQYQGYPQQHQHPQIQQQWQQQPYPPNIPCSRPDPQYYSAASASPRPSRPYDPRAAPPRQPYQAGPGQLHPSPSVRQQYPYGYPAQHQPPPPHQSSMYRSGAAPPPPQGHVQYRPVYTTTSSPRPAPVAQHLQQSPRPVYRTGTNVMHQPQQRPMNPYVAGGGYRPAPAAAAPAHVRTSSLDAVHYSNARPYQHGTPRAAPQNMQGYRSIPPEGWKG
ncbi:hypothetical protein VTP01DRAFT_8637 [Rhizomucor pusillus]|uniref:uncharacterized protein n=1 Tax=Rhizomucor pusillus TaxID=4840 RepID=UPI0037429405